MKRCSLLLVLILLGCSFQNPPQSVYINKETALALTPSATPPPTSTATPPPTATLPPTATRSPTPSSVPSATAVPTPTPDPALADLGFCEQTFGASDPGRFSAQLQAVEVSQLGALEQVTLVFTNTVGGLHGTAGCVDQAQWRRSTRTEAPGPAVLAVDLADWAHDAAFAASPLSQTVAITPGGALTNVQLAYDPLASRGLTIGVGLQSVMPYRIRTASEPERIIIEVQKAGALTAAADPLGQAIGDIALPAEPIFFLQNNDVWRWVRGEAAPVIKTDELEIALAVSPDQETLAVCRAPADSDPAMLPYEVRATLWVLRADGTDARQLADVGGCADLAFARSGKTLAFTVNTATAPPMRLSIWKVPVVVGEPQPATPTSDEWSRSVPQWLPDGRVIYRAENDGGPTTIFVLEDDGSEREITAALLTGTNYREVGQVIVNGDDGTLAVEMLRADKPGADLVLLQLNGSQIAADQRGFWQRPLAFTPEGLLYLSTECPSGATQQYVLRLRRPAGSDDLLTGISSGGIGEVVVAGDQVIYSRIAAPTGDLRGPLALGASDASADLWLMSGDAQARRSLYGAPVAVSQLRAR